MSSTPKFQLSDGSLSSGITLSTNQQAVFLAGVVSNDTASVQVSINTSGWVTDPNLIKVRAGTFEVPDPSVYPQGLQLNVGDNTISVRVIDILGNVSGIATASITRVLFSNLVGAVIPSGIRLNRKRNTVELLIATLKTIA